MRHAILTLVISTLVLASAGTAVAASSETYEGRILVGNPLSATVFGGATETATPCDPDANANGLDGAWYDIREFAGGLFTLTMDDTLDADLYFYDSDCELVGGSNSGGLGDSETGLVHWATQYAYVAGYEGSGEYKLSLQIW